MATTLTPPAAAPAVEEETLLSDFNGNGPPEDRGEGGDDPGGNEDTNPERWAVPLSAYRTGMLVGIGSISSVFAALTFLLQARWVHSKDWVSITLPQVLYWNTAVLLVSSLTIEFARRALVPGSRKRFSVWLSATLFLGLTFVGGQLAAWRELSSRNVFLASNPGSLFFYVITAAHGVHLLGGIIAIAYVALRANALERNGKRQIATEGLALYWHFMDGLWVYLFAWLLVSVQRHYLSF